ncbi:hypothetical protein COCON_G00236520 [Conger conger]|uniref:WWE domain-containing protein n=1 Tax=Conger conger TaxID=82655 RepID=A0A9Q1CTN4_CONCO|nr:hypothetical protein COCON_G00236520 [Conger conger]
MPYKWEVRNGDSWTALPDNEEIERDFCDPSNVDSRGVQPVYFDTMTRGPTQVRRLSTVSSVVQPNFILTTTWAWFWQDEHNNWIQYSSVEGQHGLSSITSEDLERKYQEDSRAVMEFTAGSHAFKLSFPGIKMEGRTERQASVGYNLIFIGIITPLRQVSCRGHRHTLSRSIDWTARRNTEIHGHG